MHVLVTRPESDAAATARAFQARGHEVHRFAVLEIVVADEPADLARPGGIVVTSGNGVRALAGWRAAGGWRDLPLFAVGPNSARLAGRAGFTKVASADGDVAALVALVKRAHDPRRGTLLYPAARDRSGDVAAALAEAGIEVATVVAYRAEAAAALDEPTAALLREGRLDALAVYSRRTAAVTVDLLSRAGLVEALANMTVLALSPAAAAPLAALPTGRVLIAAEPNEAAMLALADAAR